MYDSDAALVESISACARTEAATAGKRLAAIAELATRRCGTELARSRERWACDAWDSCAAEVAAELTISHRTASGLMHQGLDLRDRFPAVGALLASGAMTVRVATTVTWRGALIEDADLLARVDADIAEAATRFGTLSEQKLNDAIDNCIYRYDPDAVRRFHSAAKGLDVRFGKPDDETGTRSIYGLVKISDAELLDRRAEALARSVCPDDPRTQGERRTEALGIIAVNGDRLPCRCGRSDCPATGGKDPRAEHLVIHVITNHPGEDPDDNGPDDSGPDDNGPDDSGPDDSAGPAGGQVGAPARPPVPCPSTAVIAGGGVIPAPLLAELRAMGAMIAPVLNPVDLTAVPGYRPSTALQRFVRTRDITCCFPGCDRPAVYCDLDHTVPHAAGGLTHPGNLKCLCRKHHLLKTFWVGRGGWSDEQLPDGTVVWITPAGRRKHVPPGSRVLFPDWNTTTPTPATPQWAPPRTPGRELTMPLRARTRTQQHRKTSLPNANATTNTTSTTHHRINGSLRSRGH